MPARPCSALRLCLIRLVTVLFLFLLSATAFAIPVEKNPSIGEAPPVAPAATAGLITPPDMPLILPSAQLVAPPLPSSYIVKNLGWLELSYPPAAAERVAPLLANADAVKDLLVSTLGQPVLDHVMVRVAPTVSDMARLAPAEAPPPEYASGVAYHGMHLVLLSMLAPRGGDAVDLEEVFRHELVHVALEDAVLGKHVPVWFNEGLAMRLSGEQGWERRGLLWNATLSDTLLPLSELDRSFPRNSMAVNIAYAESADFMQYLSRRSDQLRFAAMIGRIREGQPFDRAVAEAYGEDLRRLEFQWRGDLEHRFSVIPILTGGGLIWVLVIAGLGVAYVKKRRRTKAILVRWGREEAMEDARLEALRRAEEAAAEEERVPSVVERVSLKIEDAGRWHTLH